MRSWCWLGAMLVLQSGVLGLGQVAEVRKVVLESACDDPIALEVAPDGRVLFIERPGRLRIWKPAEKRTVEAGTFEVYHEYNGSKNGGWEDGLIGLVLDPAFAENQWLYLYYSPMDVEENRVSRFTLKGDALDKASEKILVRVKTQRDVCCHSAGGMAFDGEGNLYVSTGDNTNPFESDGYAPIDYRPGRYGFDAARTSANANDLRGKILRVKPQLDGTITIPGGNLFPADGSAGRPEIYTMGHRNPWRISVDRRTGWLYWGEVGPDARLFQAERGPAGFDELNRTKTAGNFGWPFVIANNKPYRAFDFSTGKSGPAFDVAHPRNESPNNTGARDLPPAREAWIFYPYGPSARFPQLESGARTACAGPVLLHPGAKATPGAVPASYDQALLIYDWERDWLKVVRFDARQELAAIEPFASNLTFKHPTDVKLGPDGCLYLIEYGTAWERNKDSQVVKLEFAGGP